MWNFRLCFAFFAELPENSSKQVYVPQQAKKFVSLQVFKAIILSSLQKTAKC